MRRLQAARCSVNGSDSLAPLVLHDFLALACAAAPNNQLLTSRVLPLDAAVAALVSRCTPTVEPCTALWSQASPNVPRQRDVVQLRCLRESCAKYGGDAAACAASIF